MLNRPLRLLWILLLALVAGPALALGLGQIEVKSSHGQPLLAEIPIVSSDPGELEQLQARLASPDTFRRVGLEPPTGLVQDLQFSVALDPRGRPVLRITSHAPVQESLLTFLIEVDWGQGRLVREYSALVDTPQSATAIVQPPIQAPVAAPSNIIVREPEPSAAAPAAETTADEVPAVAGQPPREPPPEAPAQPQPQPSPAPVAAPPVALAPSPPSDSPQSSELAPVRPGQTLGEIAAPLSAQNGRSLQQTMLGLVRANPEAFIRGNINLVRAGAVLRVPTPAELDVLDATEARMLVREHVAQWRELRAPVPQPVEAVAESAGSTAPVAPSRPAAPRVADARLEIVPPSAQGARQAGTRSGAAAGGEGDMLYQQELTQARETIAARDAEVQDLKARVAELESLQQQQQQLIALKDSELAASQKRLEETNAATGPTVPTAAAVAGSPWLWAGIGVLLIGLLLWAVLAGHARRSQRESRRFLRGAPAPAASPVPAPEVATVQEPEPLVEQPRPPEAPAGSVGASAGGVPFWHASGSEGAALAARIAPLNPAPAGHDRLELARAYLDLGDAETARTLLQEVADSGDAESRDEAGRLLRGLV